MKHTEKIKKMRQKLKNEGYENIRPTSSANGDPEKDIISFNINGVEREIWYFNFDISKKKLYGSTSCRTM